MGRHADDQRSRGVARWVVVGVIVVLLLVGSHGRLPDRDAQQRHRRFRMPGTGQRGGRRRPVGVARRRRCRRRLQRRLPGGPIAVREGRGHDGLGPGRAGRPDRQDLAGRPRPGPGTVGPRRPCLPGAARHRPAGPLCRPPDRPRRLVAGRPGDPEGGRRGCRVAGLVDVAAIGRVVRVGHAVRRPAPGPRAAGRHGESGDRAGRAVRGGRDGRHDRGGHVRRRHQGRAGPRGDANGIRAVRRQYLRSAGCGGERKRERHGRSGRGGRPGGVRRRARRTADRRPSRRAVRLVRGDLGAPVGLLGEPGSGDCRLGRRGVPGGSRGSADLRERGVADRCGEIVPPAVRGGHHHCRDQAAHRESGRR